MRGFILLLATTVVPTHGVGADVSDQPAIRATTSSPAATTPASRSSSMQLVSFAKKPAAFDTARGLTFVNSDLAFGGNYVYQGNFAGFTIWDVSDPAKPVMVSAVECITSQGDPSIYGNLLFLSAEGARQPQ